MINKMNNGKLIINIFALSIVSMMLGCSKKDDESKTAKLDEVYGQHASAGYQETMKVVGDTYQMKGGFSTMPNYYPVMTPPKSASVWVPTIKNKRDDALVPGHIVFLKVYDSDWAYDVSDDYDPHHFANLRMVEVPKVNGERDDLKYDEAQQMKRADGSNNTGVFTVPVVIEKGK